MRTILDRIRRLVDGRDPRRWVQAAKIGVEIMRNTSHSYLGYTPISIHLGKEWDGRVLSEQEINERIEIVREKDRQCLESVQAVPVSRQFNEGDWVLIRNAARMEVKGLKLQSTWVEPFQVQEIISPRVAIVKVGRFRKRCHVALLKRWKAPE